MPSPAHFVFPSIFCKWNHSFGTCFESTR